MFKNDKLISNHLLRDPSISLDVFVSKIMISKCFPLSFSDTSFPIETLDFKVPKDQ